MVDLCSIYIETNPIYVAWRLVLFDPPNGKKWHIQTYGVYAERTQQFELENFLSLWSDNGFKPN